VRQQSIELAEFIDIVNSGVAFFCVKVNLIRMVRVSVRLNTVRRCSIVPLFQKLGLQARFRIAIRKKDS